MYLYKFEVEFQVKSGVLEEIEILDNYWPRVTALYLD